VTMRPGEGPRDGRADRHILGNSVQPEKMFLDPITTDSRSARRLVFCLPVLGRDERHWFAAAVLVTVFTMYGPRSRVFAPERSKAAKRSGRESGSLFRHPRCMKTLG